MAGADWIVEMFERTLRLGTLALRPWLDLLPAWWWVVIRPIVGLAESAASALQAFVHRYRLEFNIIGAGFLTFLGICLAIGAGMLLGVLVWDRLREFADAGEWK